MSDMKRKDYRKGKDKRRAYGFTLVDREDDGYGLRSEHVPKPKILLRSKEDNTVEPRVEEQPQEQTNICVDSTDLSASSTARYAERVLQKSMIVTRSDAKVQSPRFSSSSPVTTKVPVVAAPQLLCAVPQMRRPAPAITAAGAIELDCWRSLMHTNVEFFVVSVVGMQGVGKSTILNILLNEDEEYDYYDRVFVKKDCAFPTKHKQNKFSRRSRTEATYLFITSKRMILLDCPAVLSSSSVKDAASSEMDDLRLLITMLSVSHLVIVVHDEVLSTDFVRLLQLAEMMKPQQSGSEYFPHILFVTNRAQRIDFIPEERGGVDGMLKSFFQDSRLKIFNNHCFGIDRHKRESSVDTDSAVNRILFPVVNDAAATSYHNGLEDIVEDLRTVVAMTPRNEMLPGTAESTEDDWFELLRVISTDMENHFYTSYEDLQRKQFEKCESKEKTVYAGTKDTKES